MTFDLKNGSQQPITWRCTGQPQQTSAAGELNRRRTEWHCTQSLQSASET